ncbi:unnamed protein product [Phytophthora fragariaefolia]|uniref:Unnamed protein product n=1 Tax=Phytophthora fragariaefolia TaxID=1490495 RepID=A0A9W6X464_9STRA|nr:unnamed protein product [Phytophthora fragariaefolia]
MHQVSAGMLKRGSSRSSRRSRPVDSLSRRDVSSGSQSSSPSPTRRKPRKSKSRDSEGSSDPTRLERVKKSGKMKRAPLLDYSIVEAVYSAMAGQAQRRASRYWLEQFAKFEDKKRPGAIKVDKFTRCLSRMGVELDRREHYEVLVDCFEAKGGSEGTSDSSDNNTSEKMVDYAAFVDFACNVRDSAKLSEIADSLRESIAKYDGKKQSSTSYNLAAGLDKLDRHNRGWIPSTQFERALQREDRGPTFHLSAAQLRTLVDRFEYEYEKRQLGIDYMQFAQWLQPLLHLDVKKVHERVKSLVEEAAEKHGWQLGEIFKAIDDDNDGEVDAVELKEALLEMGLPLTDAQIRCLADEYDVDGDRKIQYNEFVSLFAPSENQRVKRKTAKDSSRNRSGVKSDSASTTDQITKKKDRSKRNIRNSFSWGITKAFARKQAAKSGRQKRSVTKDPRLGEASESSLSDEPTRKKSKKVRKDQDVTSSDDEIESKAKTTRRQRSRKHRESSNTEEQATSSASDNQASKTKRGRKKSKTTRRDGNSSSTESERDIKDHEKNATPENCAKGKTSKKAATMKSEDESKNRVTSDSEAPKSSSKDTPGKTLSGGGPVKEKSARKRGQRETYDEVTRSRSHRKLSRRHSPRRRHRSRSAHGQSNGKSRRKRHGSRSRSVRLRRATRNTAAYSSDDSEKSEVSVNNDSSSGLDVEQLRRRQQSRGERAIRRGNNATSAYDDKTDNEVNENESESYEDGEGGDELSRSDDEYHKHLKRSLRRAFDFFDLDQTSTIDKRELSHVLRALGHEFTSEELEAEMANADLDRNGQLDFYEFVAFVKKQLAQKTYLLSQQREMEIRQSFQLLDTDKNGALDEQEFEYLIYKVLQVELSVEEQDELLDFIDKDADGLISEDEFIVFMKKLETLHRKYSGNGKQKHFFDSLDTSSQLAYSAMKKLVRGAPMDLDRNLLMFFGVPSNFRPAISSAATCRTLHGNTMEHVLSFPSPQTIEALALDTTLNDKKDSSWFGLNRLDTGSEEYRMLQHAEGVEAQAIVSLKRAAGVPKPFDTREDDVVKRCVHVCLFQEQVEEAVSKRAARRRCGSTKEKSTKSLQATGAGTVIGNVHEIPVYWHQGEEDVWEFSKKSTKQDKYKFLVRTNTVNDHLFLLVEFIVHLKIRPEEHQSKKRSKSRREERNRSSDEGDSEEGTREMVCCWCKIPVRQLLAKRSDIMRRKEKLWGGTANAPVDIEQDELLRRRTGWRAFTNMFSKPSPPLMGIKSVPIDSLSEDVQVYVRKMPPIVIAPFISLPILAEYMVFVRKTLACVTSSSSGLHRNYSTYPALKLLPKIVDDHVALTIFRKAFDSEVASMKAGEVSLDYKQRLGRAFLTSLCVQDRQLKFQQLVLRMWPSFVHWQERLPPSLLPPVKVPGAVQDPKVPAGAPPKGVTTAPSAANTTISDGVAAQIRTNLLQTTASGYVMTKPL